MKNFSYCDDEKGVYCLHKYSVYVLSICKSNDNVTDN